MYGCFLINFPVDLNVKIDIFHYSNSVVDYCKCVIDQVLSDVVPNFDV